MKNKLSLTIGIPTYKAESNLVFTLQSVYKQQGFNLLTEILLILDGAKISQKVFDSIKKGIPFAESITTSNFPLKRRT